MQHLASRLSLAWLIRGGLNVWAYALGLASPRLRPKRRRRPAARVARRLVRGWPDPATED
jgi:hypothetical protein